MEHSVTEILSAPDSMFDDIQLPDDKPDRSAEEAIAAATQADEAEAGGQSKPSLKEKQDAVDAKAAKPEAEDEQQEAATEAVPAPVQAKKVINLKVGDEDVALDEGASLEVRVDGKKQSVTLKDLMSNYSGKIPIERRLQEVAEARKVEAKRAAETEAREKRISGHIGRFIESAQKADMLGAIATAFELSGNKADPFEALVQLQDAQMEIAKQMLDMTPEQLAYARQQQKNAYLQSKYDGLMKARESEKAEAQFQERVSNAIKSVDTTMEEYVEKRDQLKKDFKARGIPETEITPELVANHITVVKRYESARDILKAVDPDANLQDPKVQKVWDSIVQMRNANPDWSDEDITEIVQTAMNKKQGASVSAKIAKAPVATVAIAAAKAKTAPASSKQLRVESLLKQDPRAYGDFGEDDLF